MKMSKTKKPLYEDTENQVKAMRAADNMVKRAEYIAEIYGKQLMLPPLDTQNFRNLVSGGSAELERQVAQTWKDSMNKFQPGLGDASPVLPKPVEYNPPRFDRHCETLRGRGALTEHEHVSYQNITIVDGKPVITDETREAIKAKSCVFETPENKKQLEVFSAFAKAATDVRNFLEGKRKEFEDERGFSIGAAIHLIDENTLPRDRRGVIFYDKNKKTYQVNNAKLSYGPPAKKIKRAPVKIEHKPDVVPKPKPKPEVIKLRRYKSSIPG